MPEQGRKKPDGFTLGQRRRLEQMRISFGIYISIALGSPQSRWSVLVFGS
jgi:hypothetical protein